MFTKSLFILCRKTSWLSDFPVWWTPILFYDKKLLLQHMWKMIRNNILSWLTTWIGILNKKLISPVISWPITVMGYLSWNTQSTQTTNQTVLFSQYYLTIRTGYLTVIRNYSCFGWISHTGKTLIHTRMLIFINLRLRWHGWLNNAQRYLVWWDIPG